MRLITEQPDGSRLGDFLTSGLASDAVSFRGAAAFVRASGMAHLQPLIRKFSDTRPFEMIVGVDLKGSTVEGLQMLLDALGAHGRAFVYHNYGRSTFHPKLFRFAHEDRTELYVGSGNLTQGGLYTNHEAGLLLKLTPDASDGLQLIQEVEQALDQWSTKGGPAAVPLSTALIINLTASRLIWSEAAARASTASKMGAQLAGSATTPINPPFGSVAVPAAPAPLVKWASSIAVAPSQPSAASHALPSGTSAPKTHQSAPAQQAAAPTGQAPPPGAAPASVPRYYVTTLLQTDVGKGQTTAGASARSPEIFIPLAARKLHPTFWGWPNSFTQDPNKPKKYDRKKVPFLIHGHPATVNMMTWPDKSDFRLRSEALRSGGGKVGDIMVLEHSNTAGFNYVATFVPAGTPQHARLLQACNTPVRNSPRRFGYF